MKTQTTPGRAKAPDITIKKILVPLDFSVFSKKALKYALRLAQQFKAELTLFHVFEPVTSLAFAGLPDVPVISKDERMVAEKNLRALASSSMATGVTSAKSTVRTGVATHEIVEAAKELDVDLIVIATHGCTGSQHFSIGSTAARVARAAPCPVLVVREKEHDFI